MSDWPKRDNPHKKKIDRLFVSCEEEYEPANIEEKRTLFSKVLGYRISPDNLEHAIRQCCGVVGAPRPQDKFNVCVLLLLLFLKK